MSAFLVRDININTDSSNPSNLLNINGTLFFSATDNDRLTGLWKSDGSAAGTTLMREFPGGNSVGLNNFVNVNGELFFDVFSNSFSPTPTAQLWKSGGTIPGTQLVKDFSGQGFLGAGVSFQNRLYFTVADVAFPNPQHLWESDGSGIGTAPVDPGAFSNPNGFAVLNGQLFFGASDPTNGAKLWKTDGTDLGTQIADGDVPNISVGSLTAANGALYFFADHDSTFQSTDFLQSDGIHTTILQTGLSGLGGGEIAAASGKVFFTEATTAQFFPPRLWVYDGTTTRELNPANVSPFGLNPSSLHAVNGYVVFNGSSVANPGFEEGIWTSDGTDAGTMEITPSGLASPFVPLFNSALSGNALYFVDFNQLWKTDGTAPGTSLVATFIAPPGLISGSASLTFVGSTLFFTLNDGTHGQELWEFTSAGAMLVKDININTIGSFPSQMVDANGTLYFTANTGPSPLFDQPGPDIWKSDGTTAGTQLVGTPFPSGFPADLVNVNGTVFFFDANGPPQLWSVSAGTGSQLLKDFSKPNDFVQTNFDLTAVGNKVFFTVIDNNTGEEDLWQSDGTTIGTVIAKSNVFILAESGVAAGNKLFFVAIDPNTFVRQLWVSDGTDAGTHVVDPTSPDSNISGMTNVNGTLFYLEQDPISIAVSLWKTDGTTATKIADVSPGSDPANPFPPPINVNGTLYFFVQDFVTGTTELWTSNGLPGGTVPVAVVPQPDFTFSPTGIVTDAAVLNGRLIFAANDPVQGQQLWVSDGTAMGTHPIKNVTPGHDGFGDLLFNFTAFAGRVFFTASDQVHGQELWETDGTAGGTFMVQDINPGAASSMGIAFTQFVPSNGALFFDANDGTHGDELWAYFPATHLQVTTSSNLATPGSPFPMAVTALDRNGNVDTAYTGTVHFTSTDGSAILPADYTFTPGDHGVHTFTLTLRTPGVQTITATDTATGSIRGLVTLNVPTNVSNLVFTVHTRFFFNPFDGLYDGLIGLLNTSGATINGPIQIVLTGLDARIRLARAWLNGVPLSISHTASGDTVITLNISQLARGHILAIVVEFSDSFVLPINFGIQTFSDSF